MGKPDACKYCGADYHSGYEDGLVECRDRLLDQRDDAAATTERETVAAIVAFVRRRAASSDGPFAIADTIERGDWRAYLPAGERGEGT